MRYLDSTMKRRSFIAILLLLSITLFGCANGGLGGGTPAIAY